MLANHDLTISVTFVLFRIIINAKKKKKKSFYQFEFNNYKVYYIADNLF